jgi:hypothetical protein
LCSWSSPFESRGCLAHAIITPRPQARGPTRGSASERCSRVTSMTEYSCCGTADNSEPTARPSVAAPDGYDPPASSAFRPYCCALRSDRPKQDFREVILDGDCRIDRRYLEIRASSYAQRAQPNWWSGVIVSLRASTLTTPCARAPRRYVLPGSSASIRLRAGATFE